MKNVFNILTGGTFALIIKDDKQKYAYADNSVYLIDSWYSDVIDGKYFEMLKEYQITFEVLRKSVLIIKAKTNAEEFKKAMNWNLPSMIIDFDKQKFINNYPDQALENRIPEIWNGEYISDRDNFLELIPYELRYWK